MVGLLSLPPELLDEIASATVQSDKIIWSTSSICGIFQLRLIHPRLSKIFTRAIFRCCAIALNPRDTRAATRLMALAQSLNTTLDLQNLVFHAPNFLPTVHSLNTIVPVLLRVFRNVTSLEFTLDGHCVTLQDFPLMPRLRNLHLAGESLYTHLAHLQTATPALQRLVILAAATSAAPAPVTAHLGNTNQTQGFVPTVHALANGLPAVAAIEAQKMPETLTHLHISNVNTPGVQMLLLDLPFKPVHFTFSLLHNYDLTELALLLCRDQFCSRTISLHMVKSRMVSTHRLEQFKQSMKSNLSDRGIQLSWS